MFTVDERAGYYIMALKVARGYIQGPGGMYRRRHKWQMQTLSVTRSFLLVYQRFMRFQTKTCKSAVSSDLRLR